MSEEIRLTQYSHGAGCGCKLSPMVLDQILKGKTQQFFPSLLVGNDTKDDAAAFDLGDGTAIISTTDFFMPIVDDAFDFGAIASANAISDVYAMGGNPMMAIAILGWPIDKLSPEIAGKVLEGSKSICAEANIPLAGGHSIDCPEPIFGLAVTGRVPISNLKKNATAKEGDLLFLTKPLGVGILSTLEKKGTIKQEHRGIAAGYMKQLNKIGKALGEQSYVHALTDVTGFGLLGHLTEMAEGSGLSAEIYFEKVPKITEVLEYLLPQNVPGGTNRNWASYGSKISLKDENLKLILADPQTSGGLLVAIAPDFENNFIALGKEFGLELKSIGKITSKKEHAVIVT